MTESDMKGRLTKQCTGRHSRHYSLRAVGGSCFRSRSQLVGGGARDRSRSVA